MIELATVEEQIAGPAADIWRVLTDFGHPQRLAPTIDSATVTGDGVGAVRIVRSSRGLEIHEKLLACEPLDYLFRYAILDSGDMPFAHVTSYTCTVGLIPLTDRVTEICWRSEGTVDGPVQPIRDFLTTLYRNANRQIAEQIGASRNAGIASTAHRAIDGVLAGAVEAGVVPGLVGIVADADGDLYTGGHGVCDARKTIFWLASMTKLVTTVAAMQLVEEGRLSLDEPIAGLLPELADPQVLEGFDSAGAPMLRPALGAITLGQLLTHSSGIGYDAMNPRLLRARGPAGPPPPTSLASLRGPLVFDPGQGWEYGFGIDWAGLAVERCSDMPLDRYFSDRIFGPLGMTDTGFGVRSAAPERCAATHLRQAGGDLLVIPSPVGLPEDWEFHSGGAGLSGTAIDYIRFLRMLLGGGALEGVRVLAPSTVDDMWRNRIDGVAAGRVDTAMPDICLPYDPLPGQQGEWSLLGVRNPRDVPNGRRAGSASWVGAAGTFFWFDRMTGICGVLMAQLLPFADPALAAVRRDFEAAVYADVAALRSDMPAPL